MPESNVDIEKTCIDWPLAKVQFSIQGIFLIDLSRSFALETLSSQFSFFLEKDDLLDEH